MPLLHQDPAQHSVSAARMRGLSPRSGKTIGIVMLVAWIFPALGVQAEKAQNIGFAVESAVLSPGGVMLLPLTAERGGTGWPTTLPLRINRNRVLTGHVVWIHAIDPALHWGWSADALHLGVRVVRATDDSTISAQGKPFVVAELPLDAEGEIWLAGDRLVPVWRPLPRGESEMGNEGARRLDRTGGEHRPDPDSPFEYWRWVLLSESLGMQPPPVEEYGMPGAFVARAIADAWRVGFERLARLDSELAAVCRSRLTRICRDGDRTFAAWVTSPDRIARLQAMMVDFDLSDAEVARGVRAWLESMSGVFFWPELETQHAVRLALVNTAEQPMVVTLQWQSSVVEEVPLAVRLEPGVLTPFVIGRAALPVVEAGRGEMMRARNEVLVLRSGDFEQSVVFDPQSIPVRPPGVFLRRLSPPLTLDDAWRSRQPTIREAHSTNVHVRRIRNRWEVFFECRTPLEETADSWRPPGHDSVGLEIGLGDPFDAVIVDADRLIAVSVPSVALVIPRNGFWEFQRGANDGTLQIHRSGDRFVDRWYCRVVLPDSWLSPDPNAPTLLRCWRALADSSAKVTTPGVTAPWRISETFVPLDLTVWDDLPK